MRRCLISRLRVSMTSLDESREREREMGMRMRCYAMRSCPPPAAGQGTSSLHLIWPVYSVSGLLKDNRHGRIPIISVWVLSAALLRDSLGQSLTLLREMC
jgi:hypothetical protein